MKTSRTLLFVIPALVLLLAACKTLPLSQGRAAAQAALDEGIELYNKGDYDGAVKRLAGASEIWSADKSIQVTALKYTAFSYCVTGRQTLCKQQFDKALKLDPNFNLSPGERGHPLWSPVFERAKKES
jgi:Tfp pilus assembly protein PilF